MTEKKLPLSGWLVASDIDGTLNDKRRRLRKRNFDAIHKFVYEYGGHFILSSGRSIESMRKHFKNLGLNTGYAVFINGAGVYDYSQEKILWLSPVNEKITALIKKTAKKFRFATVQVITPYEARVVKPTVSAYILAKTSKLPIKKYKNIEELPTGDWCKAIFTGLPFVISKVERFAKENSSTHTNLMRTSPFSFELVNEGTNKGVAVLKVAEFLGIDKEKTAAIGDYFNDYEMLRAVGLPACCGQAPQGMKDIAKLVTCHCNKGAVADLIEYIIKNNT